jgi:hypothetical protein
MNTAMKAISSISSRIQLFFTILDRSAVRFALRVALVSVTLASLVVTLLVLRLASITALIESPFRGIWLIVLVIGVFAAVWGPGLLAASFLRDSAISPVLRPGIVILFGATIGWVIFWVWFLSPIAGVVVSVAVVAATIVGFALRPRALTGLDISRPFVFAVGISAAYLLLSSDHGALVQGGLAIAHRYWVSVDNVIPKIFADQLTLGRQNLIAHFIPGIQSSERPPLQVGLLMPVYKLSTLANRTFIYVVLGLVVNSIWVVALWSFLRALRLGERRIAVVVVSVALIGAVFLNTIYAWPKMLSASLVLVAAVFLLLRRLPPWVSALGAGSAASLAMVSHGSAAFGLLGLIPLIIPLLRRWRIRGIALGAGAFVVIYLPWFLYQQLFDPPGDRLLKWHLAGVIPRNHIAASTEILQSYAQAGLVGTIENKLTNLQAVLGLPTLWHVLITRSSQPNWSHGFFGFVRQLQSSSFLPAAGVLLVGLIVVIVSRSTRHERWTKPVLLVVGATALALVIFEFGGAPTWAGVQTVAWVQHGPYSLLLLLCAAGALGITSLPKRWSVSILVLNVIFFVVFWVVGIGPQGAFTSSVSAPRDKIVTALFALVLLLLGVLAARAPGSTLIDRHSLGSTPGSGWIWSTRMRTENSPEKAPSARVAGTE